MNVVSSVMITIYILLESNCTLRKHAYSNILNFLPSKSEKFQIKNDTLNISAQNRD